MEGNDRQAAALARLEQGGYDTAAPSAPEPTSTPNETTGEATQQASAGSNPSASSAPGRGSDGKFRSSRTAPPPVPGSPGTSAPPAQTKQPPAAQDQQQPEVDDDGFVKEQQIPYTRLRSVISERNAARQETAQLKERLAQLEKALEVRNLAFPQQQQQTRQPGAQPGWRSPQDQQVIDDIWGAQTDDQQDQGQPWEPEVKTLRQELDTLRQERQLEQTRAAYKARVEPIFERFPHISRRLFHLEVAAAAEQLPPGQEPDFEGIAEQLEHELLTGYQARRAATKPPQAATTPPVPPRPAPSPEPNRARTNLREGLDLKDERAVEARKLEILRQRGLA